MLATIVAVTWSEKPLIATPRAVPAAGGCSVLVTTITNIENPTESEYTAIDCKNSWCGIRAHKDPTMIPAM